MTGRFVCANGHEVPSLADRACPVCEAEIHWSTDEATAAEVRAARVQAEAAFAATRGSGTTGPVGWAYIAAGLVLAVIGRIGMLEAAADLPDGDTSGGLLIASVVAALGGVLTLIGVVAEGVRVGLRSAGR